MFEKFLASLRSERGSVEASMVLIPLIFLFLIGSQLIFTVHSRNTESNEAQNDASIRGISGVFEEGDRFIHLDRSGDGQNLDLLVTTRESPLISLIPTLVFLDNRQVKVHGIAIVENRR